MTAYLRESGQSLALTSKVGGGGEAEVFAVADDGEFFALNDCCTHEDASLSDGTIVGDEIECPLHGGAFEIRTGQPAAFPVVVPARMYRVRVEGGEFQRSLERIR